MTTHGHHRGVVACRTNDKVVTIDSAPTCGLCRDVIAYEHGKAAGCCFYSAPHEIDYDEIDLLMRELVREINGTHWVWTAETCQGHMDSEGPTWAHNVETMIRLVTTRNHEDVLFSCLAMASRSVEHSGLSIAPVPFLVRPSAGIQGRWVEHLIYFPTKTVHDRALAIRCLELFAELVSGFQFPPEVF